MAYDSLLVCPKNLKECIDWVLRATDRDLNGQDNNINNLKDALNAELKGFNSIDLTQLVHGLCLFMGYPSCLCSLKANVNESLQDISRKLNEDSEAVQSCVTTLNLDLNCDSCISTSVVCKCCVLDCINEVQKSSCECVNGSSNTCSCSKDGTQRCCKDLLEKLKASLSLLNLKADMEKLCQCTENCCENGECKASQGCPVCNNLKTSNDYTVTGLGLLRPSPKRLAQRLNDFFGSGSNPKGSQDCSCKCGTSGSPPNKSCCCLACDSGNCSKACSCKGSSGCSCDKALKASQCPCKTFCSNINDIKILSHSSEMQCCKSGKNCHCQVGSTCSTSPGQCCVTQLNGSKKQNFNHQSLKCLLRRLVKFFKDFESSSQPNCSKLCCDLLCVLKMCESFKTFYDKRTAKECGTCKNPGKGAKGNCPSKGQCCAGQDPNCGSGSGFCSKCSECRQICDSKKFFNELQTLQYSGPCGQDLYRVLDDFIHFIRNVFMANQNFIRNTVLAAVNSCPSCKKSGKSSKWQACQCSSGSDCQACTSLLQDSKLRSVLLSEFSSAYSSAKWDSLCSQSVSKCCGSPSCSCTSGSCPDKGCCEKCPKRLCAKIFLGILPCIYYALQYLYDKSKGGWKNFKIKDGPSLTPLSYFLSGMGYEIGKLDETKTGENISRLLSPLFNGSKFKDLYEKSQNYFTSRFTSLVFPSDSQPKTPSTVREILLWLSGLPFTPGFEALLDHCKDLCKPVSSLNFNDFESSLFNSCFLLPVSVLTAIQRPGTSEVFPSEAPKFFYPSDPSDLLDMLFENVRKVFPVLKFLCLQCELQAAQGGWTSCRFGQKCVEALKSSSTSGFTSSGSCSSCSGHDTYLCTASANPDVHDGHCLNGQCLGSDSSGSCTQGSGHKSTKCKFPCPHPLLRFLLDGSSEDLKNFPTPFKSPEDFPKMGFSKSNLPTNGWSGYSLLGILDIFVGKADSDKKVCFLRDLLRLLLCLTRTPPDTLGELFSFFYRLAEWVEKTGTDPKKKDFKASLETFIDSLPGTYSGQKLTDAVYAVYGSDHKNKNHSNTPYSLKLLAHCWNASGSDPCGNFLCPLVLDAWDLFAKDFADTYLSFICYLAKDFQEKLREFEEDFSSCKHCSSGSCKFVTCPCVLPKYYKYGFSFMSASRLNGKKCFDFIEQLGNFLGTDSTLLSLIAEIEKFLWSIRKPFFLFVLAFWAFVVSYFLYVQLYKLDLLHLKSHAHLSRSFKILPSTLFSDASSKLKDLSYFSL
ncbi:variant erythrocyte surface antigen-1 family protein [Babesia divergens]|uniref:Variant erythrocyte surface antigen-1 family protein n=1 Tax=Babesia divergens TaxID=32595 RepID=A0AAD9LG78_BABDI|nr:variant erythrocyte surface antigen-1 family protein [Babesia divergens]